MSRHNGPNIVTNGLVLYLDAANRQSYPGSGTNWHDVSENGNNGTLTNGPTFSSANGGSIVFDGVDDYVSTSQNTINSLNVSISCWIKQDTIHTSDSFSSMKFLVQIGVEEPGSHSNFFLHLRSSNIFFRYQRGNFEANVSPGITQDINVWHNYVGVSNDTSIGLYKDGVFIGESINSYSFSTLVNNNILVAKNGVSNNYYDGNISSVQIYNRALSAQEVLQNYNATKARYGL